MILTTILLAAVCACGEAPERARDFYWENDRFGMRAYGPEDPHVWSGFDVFNKMPDAEASCGEVLHNHKSCGNWHVKPWKGVLDNYTMGASRGVGAVAMYADGEWKTFPDWESCEVIHEGDDYCEFKLVYPAFSAAGKLTYHITLRRGERFFKVEASFEKKLRPDMLVGPGLDLEPKRDHHGDVRESAEGGYISIFEDPKNEAEGSTMAAVFTREPVAKIAVDNQNSHILCINRQRFTYYAGAAWSKAGEITAAEDWHALIPVASGNGK